MNKNMIFIAIQLMNTNLKVLQLQSYIVSVYYEASGFWFPTCRLYHFHFQEVNFAACHNRHNAHL